MTVGHEKKETEEYKFLKISFNRLYNEMGKTEQTKVLLIIHRECSSCCYLFLIKRTAHE